MSPNTLTVSLSISRRKHREPERGLNRIHHRGLRLLPNLLQQRRGFLQQGGDVLRSNYGMLAPFIKQN